MNQEELVVRDGYEASAEEIQTIIINWVRASEAFYSRYAQLTQVINNSQATLRRQSRHSRTRLHQLIEIRQHMSDVIMTLLLDMDMSGQKAGHSNRSSKPGQLYSHTCLLNELNKKIDMELNTIVTVAQA